MTAAVRVATAADLGAVVDVLTAAFSADPVMTWAFPDHTTRVRRLDGLWRFMAAEGYLPRRASTLMDGGDATALWLRPGDRLGDDFWSTRGGHFAAALEGDVERLSALGQVMAEHHPDDDHWYLLAVGVAPSRQGGGLGAALVADTLARADEQGVPAYLEATSERSRALYERLGFETLGELTVADSPPLWPMWRQPAPSA